MNNLQEEFGKIYDKLINKIYRFIFIKVNSQEIAEDLCSDVFLRCWQVYKQDHQKIDNIQAFIYQIARNLVTDYYRQKGRTEIISIEDCPIVDTKDSVEKLIDKDITLNKIKAVLANLDNQEYQDVLIWHYVDDLTIPEIAKLSGKTEENVRVILHRGLKAVKDKIKES
jgi:RNA polymerase sigma-70 factor (ECF subfamily)